MRIDNPHDRAFLLPNGQPSSKEETFADALRRTYVPQTDASLLFQKHGKLMAASKGIEDAVLQSYLSENPVHTFHVCCASFLAYDGPMEFPCRYENEKLVEAQTDWVRLIQYGELQDHLDIVIRGNDADLTAVRQIVSESCKKRGRAIHATGEIR